MEYNQEIIMFCERKLYPNQPEYMNCISALYISGIGYYNLLKQNELSLSLEILYWCITTNGLMSFIFHYNGWYLFKLLDEFTMIIPLWLGLSKIMYDFNYSTYYIGLLTNFNIFLLVFDIFPWFEPYFPLVFTTELLSIIPLYCQLCSLNKTNIILRKYRLDLNKGKLGIIICSLSGIIWFITELNCNKYFIFGHPIWHIGMSTGMCYIINYFNEQININKKEI